MFSKVTLGPFAAAEKDFILSIPDEEFQLLDYSTSKAKSRHLNESRFRAVNRNYFLILLQLKKAMYHFIILLHLKKGSYVRKKTRTPKIRNVVDKTDDEHRKRQD
ncbi:MAG: hypothetical protein HPY70_06320 [Firmicutes bacterium]|nr:hypothetical protein [Bacillota bacterium]